MGGACPSSRIVVSCHLRKSTVRLTLCFVSFTSKKQQSVVFYCSPTTFGPLNRVCGDNSATLLSHDSLKQPTKFHKKTKAPQTSGSMSATAVAAYCVIRRVVRRIADNPLQRTIMLKDISLAKRTQVTHLDLLSSFICITSSRATR